ncbi:MAG: hypothetical protein R3C12_17560 [Planctomycetaceae bacterium]|nr:hypothetical protein [Planctomycetaceae bacterium]
MQAASADLEIVSPSASPEGHRRSQRLGIALAVGSGWLLFLAVLAYQTANPPTVNWAQLTRTDTVILATILDPARGEVEVHEVLLRRLPELSVPLGPLLISPPLDHWQRNQRRIIPLARTTSGAWVVPQAPLPAAPRLDYPDEKSVRVQLQAVWKTSGSLPVTGREPR